MTNWDAWNRCPICGASKGDACVSRSGRVVDGRPDTARTVLDGPHNARRKAYRARRR